jgi:small subunit ribosomal protein S3
MGQKVNPISFRLSINKNWDSMWFAKKKEYGQYLIEDFKIREYIHKNLKNSGISKIFIERPTKKCIVTIFTSRPGFVIGKKGSDIDKIKNNLNKISSSDVSVNIKEIRKPELDAYLVAENVAQQLEKRIAYRKAMKRAMQSTLRLGAKGIKITVAGRLAGTEIARTEWLRADVDYGEAEAETTYGIIGVKVWIYKGIVFEKEKKKNEDTEIKNINEKENVTTS